MSIDLIGAFVLIKKIKCFFCIFDQKINLKTVNFQYNLLRSIDAYIGCKISSNTVIFMGSSFRLILN